MLETWASFYSNHAVLRTIIDFLHVGGLMLSGGCAIAADRITLIARRQSAERRMEQLTTLRGTHRFIVVGISVVAVSGLLLFAADSDNFLHSVFFWIKMGLFALLLINGLLLLKAERQAEQGHPRGWQRLTATSVASIALWLLTTLAGAGLPNIG